MFKVVQERLPSRSIQRGRRRPTVEPQVFDSGQGPAPELATHRHPVLRSEPSGQVDGMNTDLAGDIMYCHCVPPQSEPTHAGSRLAVLVFQVNRWSIGSRRPGDLDIAAGLQGEQLGVPAAGRD